MKRLTFEPLFGIQVDLLSLCDFLQEFLDDYSVVVACLAIFKVFGSSLASP